MKLAVFSDIHGNISFFEAFLKDAEKEKVDRFVFLGDAVSYYPFGCEVIQKLRELGALCIEGNHDSMLRGEFPIPENHEPVYQLRTVISEITPEDMAYVKSWPEIVHPVNLTGPLFSVHFAAVPLIAGTASSLITPRIPPQRT